MEKKDGPNNVGSPFDSGTSPADNLSNLNPNPSKPLEIGLIIGVIVVVGLSVLLIFFCRGRRNKIGEEDQQKEDAEAGTAGSPTGSEHHRHRFVGDVYHGNLMHEREGEGAASIASRPGPVPPPKDERRRNSGDSDVIHNTSGLSFERRATTTEDAPRTPTWSAWGSRNGGYSGVFSLFYIKQDLISKGIQDWRQYPDVATPNRQKVPIELLDSDQKNSITMSWNGRFPQRRNPTSSPPPGATAPWTPSRNPTGPPSDNNTPQGGTPSRSANAAPLWLHWTGSQRSPEFKRRL
ncbi:hypothetical protein PG993_012226 [Apiospora rasikravindrae]|uniref:Uncharacterized protein n=1 Tax=Apiospora rasikravindrae TaxID=990691 RepID=A0ABR1S1Z1_9PEZI